jgi:GNAT superfamily N-acetyltransferase
VAARPRPAADLIRKLESALRVGEDRLRLRGAELVWTADWARITTPDARTHYHNGVLRSILAPEALESRIDETIAHYGRLGVPFRWMVTPSTRPRDTAEALLRKGFVHAETLHAMVADPADFPAHAGGEVTVEMVGKEGLDTWVACTGRGWSMPPPALERFRQELTRAIARPDPTSLYFLARYRGAPAGTSSLSLKDDFAHFDGAAVEEELRGRGIYRAMVLERMRVLRERGIRLVTNHCVSTTSAPICAGLGFRLVCTFEVYRFGPVPA